MGQNRCYVRRNGKVWETAAYTGYLNDSVVFAASPVSSAADTRDGAVAAWDYYNNR